MAGRASPIEAMVALVLCYRSNWSTGLTWRTSSRQLAELLDISKRYVRSVLEKAAKWIERRTRPNGNVAGTFCVRHHRCEPAMVPMDRDDRPKSFAVPRGKGGVFERLFAGDIDWKAALVWLILKLHSDWATGITDKMSMATLAKWVGFGKRTVCDAIKALRDAGTVIEEVGAVGVSVLSEAVQASCGASEGEAAVGEVAWARDARGWCVAVFV